MRKPVFIPVLFALLIAGLCLFSLSGCAGKDKDASAPDPEQNPDTEQNEPAAAPDPEPAPSDTADPDAPADGPLTEEELKYFNEEFFNGDYMNIRNQFLASSYDSPEWIDFYDLLHYGASSWGEAVTEDERAAFETAAGDSANINITKVSTSNMDAMLMEYMGLTVKETNKIHLDNVTYLPEYDAYYLTNGSTNYWSNVTISAGEREDGFIRLFYSYSSNYYGDGWNCATLRETESGGYQFVSNVRCDESDVPNT